MSIGNATELLGTPKLRIFIIAFRWLALLMGLLMTELHNPKFLLKPLPFPLSEQPQSILIILIIYQAVASFYAARLTDQRLNVYLLLFFDIVVGFCLSWYYGIAYFYLGVLLPILEAILYLGISAGIMVILLVTAISVPIVILQWLSILSTGGIASDILFNNVKIFFITLVLFVWLFASSVSHEASDLYSRKRIIEENTLLQQELQGTKKEMGEIFNELETRSNRIQQLEDELRRLTEEMEDIKKRYHEARFEAQSAQQTIQQKEKELSSKQLKDLENYKRKITLLINLVEGFKKFTINMTPDETFIKIVEYLLQIIPSQTCLLFVPDEIDGRKELFAEVAASPYADYFRNYSLAMGEGAVGYSAIKLEPLKIDQGSIEREGKELTSLLAYEKSVLIAPLAVEKEILGVLYLGRPAEKAYTDENYEELVAFSKFAAIAINNARHFQKAISLGITDGLTGLYNHFYLQERITDEVKRARRYQTVVCLLELDIDNFSTFNKLYGKEMGDSALKQVAEILRNHTRETDVVSRLENDRFGILLIQSSKANAILIAERIRMAIAVRNIAQDPSKGGKISVSIGLAAFPQDASSKEELLEKAEEALEDSRKQGGNHTSFPS